jgi:hypothetical protein
MSAVTHEAQLQKLVESFKSLLDETLIVAIASDYDLKVASAYDLAHSSLQTIAQDALAEEATGFNPSGLSGCPDAPDLEDDTDSSSLATKSIGQQASQTQRTESSNTDSTPGTGETDYVIPRLTSFSEDSDEGKLVQLGSLFGDLKEFDIKYTLDKANGDFQTALDNLLNLQALQASGELPKGIDGFATDETAPGKKKGKKNRRGKAVKPLDTLQHGDPSSPISPISPAHPHEAKHQEEISYIVDRLDSDYDSVAQIYARKKHSIGATVEEILRGHIEAGVNPENEASQKQAQELARQYRNIPENYVRLLVHLSRYPQDAVDLATHLSKHFTKHPWTQRLDVRYASSLPHDIEGSTTGMASKAATQKSGLGSRLDSPPITITSTMSMAEALQARDMHSQARRDASTSATRLAKSSNPLMRQGASVYADRAREHGRGAWQATSAAADLYVQQSRSRNSIDLHGVYVEHGVRIARQCTHDWWQGLGEYKASRAKAEPFTVVTGVGRHSVGGVSQMRKAVAAALIQDGWRMQIEGGRFVITGRR